MQTVTTANLNVLLGEIWIAETEVYSFYTLVTYLLFIFLFQAILGASDVDRRRYAFFLFFR